MPGNGSSSPNWKKRDKEVEHTRRRKRCSLPCHVERNMSLAELIPEGKSAKRVKREVEEQETLKQLSSYFSMIDKVNLVVDSPSKLKEPKRRKSMDTLRTIRRQDLDDKRLQKEYQLYCEATEGIAKPVSLDEFATEIEPNLKPGMYDGILDVFPTTATAS